MKKWRNERMLSESVNNRKMDSRRRMDEWSVGQMDVWVGEWMDGWTDRSAQTSSTSLWSSSSNARFSFPLYSLNVDFPGVRVFFLLFDWSFSPEVTDNFLKI